MSDETQISYTCKAPINIAIVKYWGKKDDNLNIPLNPSISITLDKKFYTQTTINLLINRKKNSSIFIVDGKNEKIVQGTRIYRVIECAKTMGLGHPIRIESFNNFPSSAGMASSASAFASIALCLGKMMNLKMDQIKILARLGSGSACRSLYGGFVEWIVGNEADGSDSLPYQLFPHDYWPELGVILIQVSRQPKRVSSTKGMKMSVESSDLLKLKNIDKLSSKRCSILKSYIRERDFNGLCEIAMKESHTLHAIVEDTFPGITYLSPVSRKIMEFVHSINSFIKRTVCGYTFDAGPNAFILIKKDDYKMFLSFFLSCFTCKDENNVNVLGFINDYKLKLPIKSASEINFVGDEGCIFEDILCLDIDSGP